jgi:alpha-ketoglutarate-dependent 2,4-dichlorophenoxyacetate dioxygenase
MAITTNGIAFSHISVKPLHPTFGAEISGVDFSSPLKDEVFKEIYQAVTKVCPETLISRTCDLYIDLS